MLFVRGLITIVALPLTAHHEHDNVVEFDDIRIQKSDPIDETETDSSGNEEHSVQERDNASDSSFSEFLQHLFGQTQLIAVLKDVRDHLTGLKGDVTPIRITMELGGNLLDVLVPIAEENWDWLEATFQCGPIAKIERILRNGKTVDITNQGPKILREDDTIVLILN
mmetsp:Transcript_20450/g.29302  ORF Transcript_20450/g.29302 Transcript_20450/m.29302 type:complete len:167 (-) Transcript_20450:1129-1629(-)